MATSGMIAGSLCAQVNTPVDLELSLVIDVSGSVDASEYALQRDGYVDALRSSTLHSSIAAGALKSIAINVIQFSGSAQEMIPFTRISTAADANAFADILQAMARFADGGTNPAAGIDLATSHINSNTFDGTRKVIDVSGDGTGDASADRSSRDGAFASGITTINGVVIGDSDGSLADYYQRFIIGGTGAFVERATDFTGFGSSVAKKLLREITGGNPIAVVGIAFHSIGKTIKITDYGAILSANVSGLPVAMAQRDLSLGSSRAGVRDLNARLFRLRSRFEEKNAAEVETAGKTPAGKEPVAKGSGHSGKQAVEPTLGIMESDLFEVYASADYAYLDSDGIYSNLGSETDVWSGTLGVEFDFSQHVSAGLALTSLDSETELGNSLGDVDLNGFLISPYLSFFRKNFYADMLYTYAQFDHAISRDNLLGSMADSDTDSHSHRIEFNAGYNFAIGGLVTGPTAGLEYIDGRVDGYTERGPDRTALRVGAQDYSSLMTRVGWQLSRPMETRYGRITPQLRVGWTFENLGADDSTTVSLLKSPNTYFRGGRVIGDGDEYETSAKPSQQDFHYGTLGTGIRWEFCKNASMFADYEAQLADDFNAQFVSLKMSIAF